MKIALLTYSTKPRGGVVHTLALAEALAALGEDVTVWSLGRGGDEGFFRPVDPAVRAVVLGGVGSMVVTGLWSVFFPALRRADQLTAEDLIAAERELSEVEPVG